MGRLSAVKVMSPALAPTADAISRFAGYRSAIPTHTGLHMEFEAIAAGVARGEISATEGSQLVASTTDSVTRRAYVSVARIRPRAAARVLARKPRFKAREEDSA